MCYNTVAIWKAGNVVAITIMVSACLLGLPTDYQGSTKNLFSSLIDTAKKIHLVPVCPEQLGGLPTPRPPAEIEGGETKGVWMGTHRVVRNDGLDVTDEFTKGAQLTLLIAELVCPDVIILKSHSPSCGVRNIYDGSFSGNLVPGLGLTASLLIKNGYVVFNEEQAGKRLPELMKG